MASVANEQTILSYQERLARNQEWALAEGSLFFEDQGAVQRALRKITLRLRQLGIPYAVAGGMALFRQGYRRFTEDVDILVTAEGLKRIHQELEGIGYLKVLPGSGNLKDTESGVRIDFLVTGNFPGDGKPKPVAFPDPGVAGEELDGIIFLKLPRLIELKLASGMTNPGRLKDLADVQEVIRALRLPEKFGEQLHPYVHDKFVDLWQASHSAGNFNQGG